MQKIKIVPSLFYLFTIALLTPSYAKADEAIEFPPLTKCESIENCLVLFMENLQIIIPILAIIFIVLGGILYITSFGNEKRLTKAKTVISSAIIGLAITLAAPSFLAEIKKILGMEDDGSSSPTILEILLNILSFLLSVLGIITIISMVIGGMMYMTSYGDTKKAEVGKTIVKYTIIGIIFSLSSLVIVQQISILISGS